MRELCVTSLFLGATGWWLSTYWVCHLLLATDKNLLGGSVHSASCGPIRWTLTLLSYCSG